MFDNVVTDIFILAIFGAALFIFLILPRQREFKKRQRFIADLSIGTEVATYGGLVGTVRDIDYEQGIVLLEVADDLVLRVLAPAIMREFGDESAKESAKYLDKTN